MKAKKFLIRSKGKKQQGVLAQRGIYHMMSKAVIEEQTLIP